MKAVQFEDHKPHYCLFFVIGIYTKDFDSFISWLFSHNAIYCFTLRITYMV